jgi:hypothetical protein
MILSPAKNDKFDQTKSFINKAKIVFGKEIGEPIGIAYEQYVEQTNVKKYHFKEPMLYKFSNCKEFYDKFLSGCTIFLSKNAEDKSIIYLDFLLEKEPQQWLIEECNYDSSQSFEDTEVEIGDKTYNINDIDILSQSPSIQSIHKKFIYEEINLNPDFQRNEIWTLRQKSLLIESILINIPIPAFYIDARNQNKMIVIDGLQRLSTILKYIEDDFQLVDTEYLKLKGKKFSTLDRKYQRRIEDYELTFNLIRQGTPSEVAFNIFSRINTLGTPLSAQEIRHAMNMGTSTDFLKDLSETKEFQTAITEKNYRALYKRMNDKALILRYLSFRIFGYNEDTYEKNDMNAFLIRGMERLNTLNKETKEDKEYLEKLKIEFIQSMSKAYSIFEEKCFRKYFKLDRREKAPISIPLFETITNILRKYSLEEVLQHRTEIVNKFLELFIEKETDENFENGRFIDWITNATNNPDHVRKRFDKVNEVFKGIIGH